MKRGLSILAVILSVPSAAFAQGAPDRGGPTAEAIRLGVMSVDPRFRVTNIGIDTNVFNEAVNPKRDTTATAAMGTDVWLRTGRGLLTLSGDSEFVYFDKFTSERSLSTSARAAYDIRFNRLRPFASASTRDLKTRPNEEITARLRQHGTEFGGGLDARVLSKSTVRLEFRQQQFGFSDNTVYQGYDVKDQLNRTVRLVEAGWRQQLTALTTFVARASHDREAYEFQPARNTENYRVNTGFELGQLALIRGTVNVGYHQLRAERPDLLPDYSGLTANANVAYAAPSQTRIQAAVERELRQSFDARTPHYVQLGWTGTVTQRLIGRWDLQVTGGRTQQDYSATTVMNGRRDRLDRVGGGIGFTMANQLRASIDISTFKRISGVPGRDYSGALGGFSLTYGY